MVVCIVLGLSTNLFMGGIGSPPSKTSGSEYSPTWEEGTEIFNFWSPHISVGGGQRSAPRLGDLDADGDLDLVIGSKDGDLHFYWNTGNNTEPIWTENETVFRDIVVFCNNTDSDISAEFADLDGDDDLDLVVGTHGGGNYGGGSIPATDAAYLIHCENSGTVNSPIFEWSSWKYLKQSGGYYTTNKSDAIKFKETATPRFADIDNDDDLDLFIGEHATQESENQGYHNYIPGRPVCQMVFYENTGSGWDENNAMFLNIPSSEHWAVPCLNDLDGDGDLDLTISYPHSLWYLENVGNVNNPQWDTKDELVFGIINNPPQDSEYNLTTQGAFKGDLADLDGDGDHDIVLGTGSGNLYPYRHHPPEPNIIPVAVAGPDRTNYIGDVVILDGTGSYDEEDCPDGDLLGNTLEYEWSIINDPSSSIVFQPSNRVAKPFFIAPDSMGRYDFSLKVNDSEGEWSQPDNISINITKLYQPVADAGLDLNHTFGEVVILNGTSSYDEEDVPNGDIYGDVLEYEWTIEEDPSNSVLLQPSYKAASPYFVAPEVGGIYEFSLRVNDSDGLWSEKDVVLVNITPQPEVNTPPYVNNDALGRISIEEDTSGIIDLDSVFKDDEDILNYQVQNTGNLTVLIDSGNNATVIPLKNWFGQEILIFSADDSVHSKITHEIEIDVLPTNDAPEILTIDDMVIRAGMEIIVFEDNNISMAVEARDVDGDVLSYGTNDSLIKFTAIHDNTLTFTPKNENVGYRRIEMIVMDNNGSETALNLSFIIRNVNDPPYARIAYPPDNTEICIDSFLLLNASGTGDDDLLHGDKLIYEWSSDIEGVLGYGPEINITFKKAGLHTVTLIVRDAQNGLSQSVIVVNVTEEATPGDGKSSDETQDTGSGGGWFFPVVITVIIGVSIIALAVFFIMKRKRSIDITATEEPVETNEDKMEIGTSIITDEYEPE